MKENVTLDFVKDEDMKLVDFFLDKKRHITIYSLMFPKVPGEK